MNILTIFRRESMLNVKKRKLLISLSISITIFAIIALIIINNIVVEADIYSFINYQYVRVMIRFAMIYEIALTVVFSSLFLASSINTDKKNFSLQNILCTSVKEKDIVLGKYINGVLNTSCIVCAGMPVAYISLLFGGWTITKIIKFLIILLAIILLYNSIALFISSKMNDTVLSLFVSIVFLILLSTALFFLIDYLIYGINRTLIFFILMMLITIILLKLSEKSRIFLL